MRKNPTIIPIALLVSAFACTPSARVSVIRTHAGDHGGDVAGDPVKVKRGVFSVYSGPRTGYFVLRTAEDWESGWDPAKDGPRPQAFEDGSQMALFAVAEGVSTGELKIRRVVESATHLHAFVTETLIGEGCTERPEKPPFDAVILRRSDKPIQFHVESGRGRSCGDAPEAGLKCRMKNAQEWLPNLNARPGDAIECEATSRVRGSFAVVDRILRLTKAPQGSTSKLSLTKGATRGAFTVDVYGKYSLSFEATDDAGRRGSATSTIDATPPKTDDVYVQLAWSNFDQLDDPATFPRVKLALREIRKAAPPARGRSMLPPEECSRDAKNHMPNCDLKELVGYAHAKLKAQPKKVELSVRYQDERVEKGPMVCIRAWHQGELTLDSCDRLGRAAESTWTVGQLDLATGKLFDPNAPPAADADAGPTATDAGASPTATPSQK